MKPELNQTQAIYPLEDPKPKVCVTTTNVGERIASHNENFLLAGANCSESHVVMKLYAKKLVSDIAYRVVTKISSCRVNTTSRRGIKRLGISFGSIFLLFSNKSSRGPLS